jgi:hypothetical protein
MITSLSFTVQTDLSAAVRMPESEIRHTTGTQPIRNDQYSWGSCLLSDCLNAKSKRSAWCRKAELNEDVDSDYNHGGSSKDICITSDWTYTRRASVSA